VVSTTAHNSQEQLMTGFTCQSVPSLPSVFAPVDRDPGAAAGSLHQRLRTALLDEIALGLIVCDRHGQLQFANPAAAEELATGRVLCRLGQTLRCAGSATSAWDGALRKAATKGLRQLLTLAHGAERLMVAVLPLALDNGGEPLLMLVLGRRGACSALGLEMLSGVYGLTFAERRVLCGLVDDVSPRDIAASGGVSLSTVRTQIASIRTKFGVRNIEGLLIRVAEVPVVPSALRRPVLPQWGAQASCNAAVQVMAA
jgi:DNA-binding CsgD family transcriptional regulator